MMKEYGVHLEKSAQVAAPPGTTKWQLTWHHEVTARTMAPIAGATLHIRYLAIFNCYSCNIFFTFRMAHCSVMKTAILSLNPIALIPLIGGADRTNKENGACENGSQYSGETSNSCSTNVIHPLSGLIPAHESSGTTTGKMDPINASAFKHKYYY